MIEYAARTPAIPIPFHKLLKVVALVDAENSRVRELLERIKAANFEIEISDRYDRDVSEDAEVGAYIAAVDGDRLQLRSAGRVPGAGGRSHQVLHLRGSGITRDSGK
jgi:ornithine decarboxylase